MINMQQPAPDKLFDKYQGQRRNPPVNQSVVAQISDRPAPASSIPPVQQTQPVAAQGQPPAQPVEKPVNPLTALYQSGLMEQAIQAAGAGQSQNPLTQLYQSGLMEQAIQQSETRQPQNPLTQLYQSGFMTQSILDAEDKQYEQELAKWKERSKDPLMVMYDVGGQLTKEPEAPARDLEQIGKDWQLGAKSLRGQELGNILHQIESGQINPEQDLLIAQHLEPELPDDIKKQLEISRLTRDKFQELQQQAVIEEQEAEAFGKESTYMNPFQIASDPRFGSQSQRTNVLGRTFAKGATANYAFAPDKDKLNSENHEEQAGERAKRLFYQQQESDYPVTALSGNILGAIAPIGATGVALRSARVAGATRNLQTSLLSANQANKARGVIATRGAPQTLAGTLGESAATGFVYDIASRPEGSEEMNLKENLFARGQNVGFGMATGLGFDLGLMGVGKAWRKLQQLPGNVVNKVEVKRRQELLGDIAENNGYKNVDDMLDDIFLKTVTDETGERIRLQTEVMDTLPEFKELIKNVTETQTARPQGNKAAEAATDTATTAKTPERLTTGEAEAPVQRRTEPVVEEPTITAETKAEAPTKHKVSQGEIIEAPINDLKLSEDVPQFKEGANQQGVVDPLGGTFDRTGVGPIQVWVRNDGSKEVISGRHRLDLARRSGEQTIPAQYHYESQGFGKQQAAALDAILNIREGQGKVKDYVDFIKATGLTKAEADAQGILARATGRRAYTIADSGTDALITAHRANQLTDEAATRIASAAPNNEALQAVGIKAVQDGKTITVAENMVKAVKTMTDESAMKPGGDMFGFDDSALKEAEALARKASAKQAEIQRTLSAVQGAAKNPELAAKEGVDVKDPEAVKRRIAELRQQKQDWQNWHTNPELTAQLRGGEPPVTAKAKQEPSAKQEPKPPDQQEGFDLTTQTESELSAKAKTASEAEAAQLKQQQDLEAKTKVDQEAKDFELGIQGSGKDVSAKQTDLLGTGKGEQPNRQPSVKSEPEPATKPPDTQAEAPKKLSFNNDTGQVELNGKTLTKGRKSDLRDAVKEGIASGELPGRIGDYKLDKPEGKRRWVAEYKPSKPKSTTLKKSKVTQEIVDGDENARSLMTLDNELKYNNVGSAYLRVQTRGPVTVNEAKAIREFYSGSDGLQKLKKIADKNPTESTYELMNKIIEFSGVKDTKYKTITNNPDPKAKDLKGGPYTLDYHNNLRKALAAGELSVDDLKAAFRTLMDNQEEVLTRFNKYKKDNLIAVSRRYAANKKDAVENAFKFLRNTFLLGKEPPSLEYDPFMMGKGAKNLKEAQADQLKKITEMVESLTQKDLDNYASDLKQRVAKAKKTQAETKTRVENPQTLEDYQLAIRENGKESLTKAQTAEYERLTTEADWQAREARQQKENIVKGLETEEALEIQPITEGTHSRSGETIYNVKVETRLGKQKFQEAAQQAKAMKGGYYKGNFWLKTREEAEQFIHWLNGQAIDRTPNKMAQETSQANKQVGKLRTMADKLQEQGTTELNSPRTTNTARQMDQAASARGQATKKINFAQTLRNIADGIEDGSVRFLSKLSNMTQLDTLNSLKRQAVPENMMDSSYNGYSMNRQLKQGVSLEDYIDKIEIPKVQLHRDKAVELAAQIKGKKGFAPLRHELEKQISIAIRSDKSTISMSPHSDYAGLLDNFVRKYDADPGWLYKQNMENIKRLQRMGITSDEHLRSAIRELETVRSTEGVKTPKECKLDDMRFKIKQGVKQFNDFFPTPEDIVNRVMELADIRPGMKTLEPNAGMGHIAKKLQALAGKDNVDLVEMAGQLVDYLKTAGHKVTQSDFLKYGEKGSYDRIVMNPPFSKDQDIDHVMHAYDLLKPGGKMTAIMSNMAGLRTNKKNRAFSQWLDDVGAHVEDLEAGAFKSSFNPTSVNTKVVVVEKPLQAAKNKAAAKAPIESRTVKDTPIPRPELENMKTAIDAANWLEANAKESAFREIIKTIKHLLDPETKMVLSGDGRLSTITVKGRFHYRTDAQNNILKNHIEISDQGMRESTLTHELIHAATTLTVRYPTNSQQKKAVQELRNLLSSIKDDRWKFGNLENLTQKEQSAISLVGNSLDEFITYSLTNADYQSALKKIKPSNSNKTLFGKLTDSLKKLLGFSENDGYLERAINASSALIDTVEPGYFGKKVDITAKDIEPTPTGTSLYSTPIVPAFKKVANMMHLNPGSSFGGAVYGGIYGGDKSEAETYSAQWWLASATGALGGAAGGALGGNLLTKTNIKGKPVFTENSHANDAWHFVKKQIRKLPGMDKGNQEAIDMAKQRDLMKVLIERQAEKAAEYLYKNFTPAQRATMADLIEGRGIIAEGNLLHRQAKELDDFVSYTGKKMQELGMLSGDIEPGAYLHRYYSKHLGLAGLGRALTPKGKAISGTWSIRRGTQEVFDDKYMSKSMRDTMTQVEQLQAEYKKLENKSGDLVGTDTQGRMAEIKTQLKELQSTEFREYLMPENGTLKSFFMAADEVPVIPKMKQTTIGHSKQAKAGLNEPGKQGRFRSMDTKGLGGETEGPILTDRRWTIDGMKTKGEGILHRDWTKAERVSWGEIDDAAYRVLRGQAEVAHDLSLGTFYKAVNDRFNGTKVSDVPIEGWQKVPETEVKGASRLKKYGALEGKYVSDDIWKVISNRGQNPLVALFESSERTKGAVPAVKTYLKLLSKWKTYKTVYNPVSHMNNSVSNLMMYNLSDYEYKYLAQSFKELRKGDMSEWVREARNNGLFGNDWTSEITGKTGKRNIDELLEKIRTQPDIPDFEQSLDGVMQLKQWFIESSNAVKGAEGTWKTGAELAKAVGNPLINTAKKTTG